MLHWFKTKSERRDAVRLERPKSSEIIFGDAAEPVPCRIRNISTTGAQLGCEDAVACPKQFVLRDSAGDQVAGDVVWGQGMNSASVSRPRTR